MDKHSNAMLDPKNHSGYITLTGKGLIFVGSPDVPWRTIPSPGSVT